MESQYSEDVHKSSSLAANESTIGEPIFPKPIYSLDLLSSLQLAGCSGTQNTTDSYIALLAMLFMYIRYISLVYTPAAFIGECYRAYLFINSKQVTSDVVICTQIC